jgi:predicted nucleotidyltransferase
MKRIKQMTLAELGAHVQSHLREKGIDVVLSGGAVVAIYVSGKYVSSDLDFANRFATKRSAVASAMEELGFT